jgi:hypothetical protein
MSIELANDRSIRLSGSCPLEEAEELLRLLLDRPGRTVDWSACGTAHTAVIQVLLALRPAMTGPPVSHFLRTWVDPHLRDRDAAA